MLTVIHSRDDAPAAAADTGTDAGDVSDDEGRKQCTTETVVSHIVSDAASAHSDNRRAMDSARTHLYRLHCRPATKAIADNIIN